MSRPIDLKGLRFGRLVALRVAPARAGAPRAWICQCDCGSLTGPIQTYCLTKGHTRSCGCLRGNIPRRIDRRPRRPRQCPKCLMMFEASPSQIYCSRRCRRARDGASGDPIELTGQRFTRLTVLGLAPKHLWPGKRDKSSAVRSWSCRCDCGELCTVTTNRLTRGNTRSCGCLQRDKARLVGIHNTQASWRRICPQCGAVFQGTVKQRFCRRQCKEAYDLVQRQPWSCEACGKPFLARRGQRYCSVACKDRSRSKTPISPEAILKASNQLEEPR